MRWLGHLVRMPPGHLPGEVFRACPTGRRPRGRPRTRWRDYVSRLAWERLGIPREELDEVAGEREVWASLLRLLPPVTRPWISGRKRKKRAPNAANGMSGSSIRLKHFPYTVNEEVNCGGSA
ncbi:hypothetical protein N1851_012373 [Merluccius polli]|uniref:Uncharacterized protein n=1 Tax=Merluccius polli TaxID=89951 RepID=A0AA47MWH5_MERPO|nr:hypothetical protein N1851_012373 [Merluccius polli]